MPDIVPIIDIAPFREGMAAGKAQVAAALDRACVDIGFLIIAGHGVPQELIKAAFGVNDAFFALPLADKMSATPPIDAYRGYQPVGVQRLAYSLDDETPPDLFERFSVGRPNVPDDAYHRAHADTYFVPNVYPSQPPEFATVMCDYYAAMEALSGTLMQIFAHALELPEDFFVDKIDRHITVLCVNHYPEQPDAPLPGQLRAGAHSDYGSLTIVGVADAPGGLQVRDHDGEWQNVVPPPGTFVVNLGDLMAQWTNDRWVSTIHRVANPPRDAALGAQRTSILFFHQPNEDAVVECLPSCVDADHPARYGPTTSGEYLMMKMAKQHQL